MKQEDKIIELLNDSVKPTIDLDENYHILKAKINYDNSNKEVLRRKPNWVKSLSLSAVCVVIALILIPTFIYVFAPMKKNKSYDSRDAEPSNSASDSYFENKSKADESYYSIEPGSSIYLDYISANINYDKIYVEDVLITTKEEMEEILILLNISDEVIEMQNTYALKIGKMNNKEVLAYTNGDVVKTYDLNLDYKIEDIYNQLHTSSVIHIKVEDNHLVYYTSADNKVVK